MIDNNICRHILTIGTDFSKPRGGIAQVLNTYSSIYNPFIFIATTKQCNMVLKYVFVFFAWIKFIVYCLKKDIYIIHIHGASYNSFWRKKLFIDTAHFFHKKIVYHIHGGEFDKFSFKHRNSISKTLNKANTIICLSAHWETFFKQEFHLNNVSIIPNITPSPTYTSNKSETPTAIFLGALNEKKGIYDLLKMISVHQDELRKVSFKLHIGGNGQIDKVKQSITDYGITDIVTFEGWVDSDKKTALLSSANIYILPSYAEGLPISILEAMSYKMAILSTPVGGIPEVVKENINGHLTQPGDIEALFIAVMDIATNKTKREEMGLKSYELVQPYLPKNVEMQLSSLYKKLITTI